MVLLRYHMYSMKSQSITITVAHCIELHGEKCKCKSVSAILVIVHVTPQKCVKIEKGARYTHCFA